MAHHNHRCRTKIDKEEYVNDDCNERALANSKMMYLTPTDMAIQSRKVYYTFVPEPGPKTDLNSLKEWQREALKLNVTISLEKAANMCGLNGQKLVKWYLVSKWARENRMPLDSLDLEKFQLIIERYAQTVRKGENIKSLVEKYLKENDEQLEFDLNSTNNENLDKQCKPKKCKPKCTHKIDYCAYCITALCNKKHSSTIAKANKTIHRAQEILKKKNKVNQVMEVPSGFREMYLWANS